MSKFCITMILASLAMVFAAGCSTPETFSERTFRIGHAWMLDRRMMVDDGDNLLLIDKNSRLSKWHQRVGY